MYNPSSRLIKSYACTPTLGGLGLTIALMGIEVLEELASKKDLARAETREAGRGVVVLGRSGVELEGAVCTLSAGTLAGDTRPGGIETRLLLLLRLDELNAEGGNIDDAVFEIRLEPPLESVSNLPSSSACSSLLLILSILVPARTSSSYVTVFVGV